MACLEFVKKKNLKLSLTHMIFGQKTRHDRHTRQGSTIALCCVMTEVGGGLRSTVRSLFQLTAAPTLIVEGAPRFKTIPHLY